MEQAQAQIAELRSTLDLLNSTVTSINNRTNSAVFALPGLAGVRQDMRELETNLTEMQATVDEFDQRLGASGEGGMPTDAELQELEESLTLVDRTVGELSSIPAEVMTTPFVLEMEDITPVEPTFTVFYSPGVIALLAQHLAIALGALTMARMRLLRITDMLRIAPVRAVEVVIGSYISYAILCGIAVAALFAAVRIGLDVPVVGSYLLVAAAVTLLILCSLGIGFVISLLASSVQQAVQVSMLVLLGSIFFSGFVFSMDQISWPVRALSHVFPATYGIRTLQDVMLRGILRHPEDLLILGVAALVLFVVAAMLMKWEFRPD
jgi:ABC-2 type transport system permease protein